MASTDSSSRLSDIVLAFGTTFDAKACTSSEYVAENRIVWTLGGSILYRVNCVDDEGTRARTVSLVRFDHQDPAGPT